MFKQSLSSLLLIALTFTAHQAQSSETDTLDKIVKIQHIRNATEKVTYGDTTFLVDPMLANKDAYPGFQGTFRSEIRNPMLQLSLSVDEIIKDVDAVIVTHSHLDHWDEAAQKLLPKHLPIFTQHQADADLIKSQGFSDVRVLNDSVIFNNVTLHKISGQHGSDKLFAIEQIAKVMGEVMGVVFEADGYKTTYIAGDTVWQPEVAQALKKFKPELIVLNTGDAKLAGMMNESILMGKEDVLKTHQLLPKSAIIAVHMDTLNHCTLSRSDLRTFIKEKVLQASVIVPRDGQILRL